MKTQLQVFGLCETYDEAERIVRMMRTSGYQDHEISIIRRDNDGKNELQDTEAGQSPLEGKINEDGIGNGIVTGGVIGGIAGLAAGALALTIPGIGPIIAAGPIAAAFTGATTGGFAGALIDWGIPAQRSEYYEDQVSRGKCLISVDVMENEVDETVGFMNEMGAKDVEVHQTQDYEFVPDTMHRLEREGVSDTELAQMDRTLNEAHSETIRNEDQTSAKEQGGVLEPQNTSQGVIEKNDYKEQDVYERNSLRLKDYNRE